MEHFAANSQIHEYTLVNMLTINQCRAILKADKTKFTDEQIIQIRDFLYHLADIAIDGLKSETKEKINKNSKTSK
jgi:hypothetical protein